MTTLVHTTWMESDEQLHRLALAGDREAFGRIVEQYHALVCSVAYSACGNAATSEDLAQEAFLAAWQHLGELREPSQLRAWLCGIVRNRAATASRRIARRGGPARPLEGAEEPPSQEHDPASAAVSAEEETLVWKSLGALPEIYREPLVLFYRENQSVAEVARQLELSEESVRQRLSRGRAALRAEVMAVVESAIVRTRPGPGFVLGVLAAISALAAPRAGAAVSTSVLAVHGASTGTKAATAKTLGGLLGGPVVGLIVGWLGARTLEASARSEAERRLLRTHAWWATGSVFGMCALLVLALTQAGRLYPATRLGIGVGVLLWVAGLVALLNLIGARMQRKRAELHAAGRPETARLDPSSGRGRE